MLTNQRYRNKFINFVFVFQRYNLKIQRKMKPSQNKNKWRR